MTTANTLQKPRVRPPLSKPDRRRHYRAAIRLGGRFMFNDVDHTMVTADISCGGARFIAKVNPPEGTSVICYFDDLGRVMAKVVRHLADGFAVAFETTAHKRDKLADRLIWLVNQKRFDLRDERATPRYAGGGPALVTRANGTKLQCRVIDISLTGAAFHVDGPSPLVGELVRAGSIKGEVVRSAPNAFAIRFLSKNVIPEPPQEA